MGFLSVSPCFGTNHQGRNTAYKVCFGFPTGLGGPEPFPVMHSNGGQTVLGPRPSLLSIRKLCNFLIRFTPPTNGSIVPGHVSGGRAGPKRNLERCAKVNNTSSGARGYRLFCLWESRKGFQGISTSVRVLYRYIRRYRASKALSECATLLTTPAALRNRRSDKMKRSSSRGIDSESNGKAYNRFCTVCETIATVIVHNSGSRLTG